MISLALFPALLALQAASAPARAAGPPVVARVRFENPSLRSTKNAWLRGALPLPPTYEGARPPLALAYGDRVFPTQLTVLTTYPAPDPAGALPGRPEIVELSARVDVPPFPGLTLTVVEGPPPLDEGSPNPGPELAKLLAAESPLAISGSDLFGNEYEARIPLAGEPIEFFRRGPLVETRIHAVTMKPRRESTPGAPALPALWRARAYVTLVDGEDFLLVDLLLHNGPVRDAVLGPFYFRELEASVPEAFQVVVWEKAFGPTGGETLSGERTRLALVPPLAGGKMHFVPDQACFTVRTAIAARSAVARARSFLNDRPVFVPVPGDPHYSWSNAATARYDANKFPVPLVPDGERDRIVGRLEKEIARVESAIERGGVGGGFLGGKLGWAFPYENPYGGVTGGGGLSFVHEHEAVATGHRRSLDRILLLMDRVWEREYHTLFFEDGRPFALRRHPFFLGARVGAPAGEAAPGDDPHPTRNFLWRGWAEAPAAPPFDAHARAVAEKNLRPDYEGRLRGYDSFDQQHRARAFQMLPAYYLLGDGIARDHLLNLALVDNAIRWKSIPWADAHVAAHPGKGIPGGRADGWTDHLRAAAFNVSRDPEIREELAEGVARSWAVIEKAQSPETGNFVRNPAYEKIFAGAADWDQAWESGCIMADGAKCAVEMFRGGPRDELATRIEEIFRKRARLAIGAAWNAEARAPYRGLRIGPPGKPDELFVPPVGEGAESFYMGTPFAWFHDLTGDRAFLDRAFEASGFAGDREKFVSETFPNGMWTYLVWKAQQKPRLTPRKRP